MSDDVVQRLSVEGVDPLALADVLTRLVVIYLRGRRLAASPAAPAAAVSAGVRA